MHMCGCVALFRPTAVGIYERLCPLHVICIYRSACFKIITHTRWQGWQGWQGWQWWQVAGGAKICCCVMWCIFMTDEKVKQLMIVVKETQEAQRKHKEVVDLESQVFATLLC